MCEKRSQLPVSLISKIRLQQAMTSKVNHISQISLDSCKQYSRILRFNSNSDFYRKLGVKVRHHQASPDYTHKHIQFILLSVLPQQEFQAFLAFLALLHSVLSFKI